MKERKRVQKFFTFPSKTQQSFKQECDINEIMRKFKKVCNADFLSKVQGYAGGQFGDFSNVTDYRSALDEIDKAKAVFGALPARVRARFENDAAQFLDFAQNPKNVDEMVLMGLAKRRESEVKKPVSAAG